jgi:hypothetical protein
MHECNAQTLILPSFGPKRWDVTSWLLDDLGSPSTIFIVGFQLLLQGNFLFVL